MIKLIYEIDLFQHLEDPNFLEYLDVCGKKNLITRIIKDHVEPETEQENSVEGHNVEIKKEDEEEEEDKTKSAAFSSISDLEVSVCVMVTQRFIPC